MIMYMINFMMKWVMFGLFYLVFIVCFIFYIGWSVSLFDILVEFLFSVV